MAQVVLVTGCSRGGIGFYLCEQFAEVGCKVYATARKAESMVGFTHSSIKTLTLDVTKDEDIKRVVDHVLEVEGRMDILVNNAGIFTPQPILDLTRAASLNILDTNVASVIQTTRAVASSMAKRGKGRIINIGSVSGNNYTWVGAYCASKAALHTITESLWMECRPLGIDVMLVAPGAVKSNLVDNTAPHFHMPDDSMYGAYVEKILARMHASQGEAAMSTDECARQIVQVALKPRLQRYLTLGGHWFTFALFEWLPTSFVLNTMWKMHGALRG